MGVSKHGIGGREVLKAAGWDLDSDVLLQYGTFDTADIRAWGFGIAAGRSFNMPWRHTLQAEVCRRQFGSTNPTLKRAA